MSGGSLDYAYGRVDDVADAVASRATKPLHGAFAKHLRLVAAALHDLEWVWSSDMSNGDEDAAIRAVISRSEEISAAREAIQKAIEDAQEVLRALPLEGE